MRPGMQRAVVVALWVSACAMVLCAVQSLLSSSASPAVRASLFVSAALIAFAAARLSREFARANSAHEGST